MVFLGKLKGKEHNMVENFESTALAAIVGGVIGAITSIIIKTHTLKKVLKEEIVEPDIKTLQNEIKRLDNKVDSLEKNFKEEVNRISVENNRLSDKIDKNFYDLNKKIDTNAQGMSKIEGMVTVIFNSMKQGYYEQQ